MRHPFEAVPPSSRRRVFLPLAASALGVMIALTIVGAPLTTERTPLGILDLEFAATADDARAILSGWGPRGVVVAAFTVGLDYVFLLAYGAAIAAGAVFASPPSWARAGRLAGWAATIGAALDAVENVALWRALSGDASWQPLAVACAVPKFVLVLGALAYVGVAALRRRVRAA